MLRRVFSLVLAGCLVGSLSPSLSVHAQNAKFKLPAVVPPVGETVPRILDESSVSKLTVPFFSYTDEPQCDSDGDVFFHLFSGSYRSSVIFELTSDVDKSLIYRLPPDLARTVSFESYSVTPSGELYVMGQIRDGSQDSDVHEYLFTFSDSDGMMRNQTRLETPPYILADGFAVLQSGDILFSGHFIKEAPEKMRGKRYAGLFDTSGKLIREIDAQGKVDMSQFIGGTVARGRGGDAYLLGGNEIVVVSPAGEVSRHIPFHNPDPKAVPTSIRLSQGLVSITLSKVGKDGWIEPRFLVLDDYTGDFYGYYTPSKDLGNEPLCFSRKTGYTFLKTAEDGKTQEILQAPLK